MGEGHWGGVITIQPSGDTSGATDLANLKAAHDELVSENSGTVALAPGGNYYIAPEGMDWRTHKVNLQGNTAKVICLGDFLRLVANSSDPQYGSESSFIESLKITGPGRGTSAIAFHAYSAATAKSPRPTLRNIHSSDFGKGFYLTDRGYLAMFYHLAFASCGVCFHQAAGADAGENISWFGGVMGNSDTGVLLEDDTSQLSLFGVSLDYLNKCADINAGILSLYGCHLERHSGYNNTMIDVSGDASVFQMFGGDIVLGQNGSDVSPYNFPAIINLESSNAFGLFDHVSMHNIRNVDETFAIGPGRLEIRSPIARNAAALPRSWHGVGGSHNLLGDGGFEQSTVGDLWHVHFDQSGTYTSRLVSGALTLAKSTDRARTGSGCLKITRGAVDSGYLLVAGAYMPLPNKPNRRMVGRMFVGRDSAAGNVIIKMVAVKTVGSNTTTGRYTYSRTQDLSQQSISPSEEGIAQSVTLGNGQTLLPNWADAVVLQVDVSYNPSGVSFYLDDISVEVV